MDKIAAFKGYVALIIFTVFITNVYVANSQENNVENDLGAIKVAVLLAKTGEYAISTENQYEIIRLAVKEINEKGGVLSRKIELIEVDTQSTALGAKFAARKVIKSNPVAVIGPGFSSTAHGAALILQEAKIPTIATWATNPNVTLVGDYIFRVCYVDQFQGTVMARYALNDLNAKTAVVLTNTGNKYSAGLSEFFMKSFEESGGKVLWERGYASSAIDYKLQLLKTKQFNPDVVYIPGYERDSGHIIKQAKKMGIASTFLGGDGWDISMYKFGGDAIDDSYFSSHWHRDDTREISQNYVKRFEKNYGTADIYALSYDAVSVLADAIKRAKSTEPQKIQQSLAKTKNFPGITGDITFDDNGDPINKAAVILKFKNRGIEFVKTISP